MLEDVKYYGRKEVLGKGIGTVLGHGGSGVAKWCLYH